jgi:SpoVK/Ycf46/Vps4 family AAA+-type ATPase
MKRSRTNELNENNKKSKIISKKINKKIELSKIELLEDLIKIAEMYSESYKEYKGINLRILNDLLPVLNELNSIIGLNDAKMQIVTHILYLTRGLGNEKCNECIDCDNNIACVSNITDKFHTVIYGPPGVGKTIFAKILSRIYSAFGTYNEDFHMVNRSDLISGYMGRTAKKTQKIIDSCENGVLFIDEAYSLGSESVDTDTYSKECIDTLNLNLMEKNFICIIAGYKDELEKCFFSKNPGLSRRFRFVYNLNGYTSNELYQILLKKIKDINWFIDDKNFLEKFIEKSSDEFEYYGGSIEAYLTHIKIAHSLNLNAPNKHITKEDLINGFESYVKNKK